MYTTSWLLALYWIGAITAPPSWHHDYGTALARAEAAKKPLAVFIGSGTDGWKALCQEGEPSLEVRRLLAAHYICVYVDADKPAQQKLVRSFEAGQLPLVVLSNHSGVYQSYRHAGKLANAGLARALQRHAAEDIVGAYEDAVVARPETDYFSTSAYVFAPCRT